jgi:hypothetical protein
VVKPSGKSRGSGAADAERAARQHGDRLTLAQRAILLKVLGGKVDCDFPNVYYPTRTEERSVRVLERLKLVKSDGLWGACVITDAGRTALGHRPKGRPKLRVIEGGAR